MDYKKECIKIIAEKLGIEESKISSDQFLSKDLGADSLDIAEIEMEIEKVCKIIIDNNDYCQHEDITIGQLIDGIKKLADEKG